MLKDCTLIEPLYCQETESVMDVAKKLREHVIRHIFIVDTSKKPVGVISITDMNNRVVAEGKDAKTLKAHDIMTKPVVAFEETSDEKTAYESCVKQKVATCPVTRQGQIIGMVTIHELLRKIAG